MTRKKLILACAFLLLTFLGAIWSLFVFSRQPGINRWNAERIVIGMTEAQVEELLGGTAGDRAPPTEILWTAGWSFADTEAFLNGVQKKWLNDKVRIWVFFDSNDRVISTYIYYVGGSESFLDKMRVQLYRLLSI
jgi:hypothetical protein